MSWLTDIKNKFLDDEGFFQRGKIAPLNKLGNKIRANVAPKPVVPNPYQPRQSFQQQSQPQFQSLPVLEPPKPTFKTEAASKLNARLDAIKRYGSSDPFAVKATKSPLPQPEFAQPVMEKILRPELIPQKLQLPDPVIKQPVNEFWNTKTGRGLVKAQEFTKPMADNMEQSIKTYKEDPTKIVTEGVPKLAKGLLVDTPKAMARWAWNTGEVLSGKKQQELDDLNREQEIKNKMMWNKLEVAKRYRESGNIEMADKVLNEVKRLNNSDSGKVYDDFIANNEVEKNQYIADAITTGMTVAGAGQPLNPKNLLAGGAISGTIGLVSGKDPFEAAGEGIANAQRWKAVTQFTNPAITKTINTFVNEKTAPVVSTVLTKLISGTGNVVEDRLIDKLEMKDRTIWNDVTSFVLGAVMGSADPKVGKWTKSDFSTATIKKQLADDLTKSGRLDPKDVETLNNVVDRIISIGVNPDGSLKMRQGSTNLFTQVAPEPKVKTGEEPLIKKRTPEEITAIVENLRRQNYGDRQISQILKSEGIDTTNLNLKGDVTTIDGILKKKTFEPKPIRVKGTDINTEQLIREGWETDKIDYAIKQANNAKVTPDNAEAYVRGILKKQYPNQASKMGRPLPPEPSAEEIARMDRNAGEQPIKTGTIKSPSITSNRPDLTNETLNKGFGEIDDLHTIDPKTGKLISKPDVPIKTGGDVEPKLDDSPDVSKKEIDDYNLSRKIENDALTQKQTDEVLKTKPTEIKVPTSPEIVKPKTSSEVVKAKKTTVNEILQPKQAEIREHNEKEIKKLLEGGFEPKTKAEPNYKIKGFDARSRYSKVDVNTIKDQELRTKVRAVKNLEAWAADNKIKNAEGKIDSGWAEVAKVEEKIKMQKDNPVEMETIIRNVNTEEGIETVFEQRPKRKFVNDDYEAFDQKPPESGKPPRKGFDPTKDKQKTEKVQLTDEEMATKDADIKARLVKWAGKVKQGRSMATNQAKQFSEIPSTLRDEIINAREQTDVKPSAEAEKYAGKFGKVFDTLHKIATKYGVNVEFRKDYFTHLWKTDADGNLIKNGRSVSSKPYFTRKQQLTWQEGLDMGLEPRFKTAQEALEAYSTALYKSIANKQLIDGLKKDGLAFDQQVGYQYKPVSIGGYRNELDGSNILYLPKKSAEMFEKVFNPKQAEAWWEKGLEATAKFGKGVTQTVLSGGYRTINAMGIGKLFFKELPSGNFNAFIRFGQAFTNSGAEKLYKDIEPDIKWLQGLGIDISAGKQNVSDYISNANYGRGFKETIKKAFKDNMESPTFDYFIPATQVDFARSIRKAGIKQGLSTDEVNKAVVDAMKQHYDVGNSLDSMLKNKNLNNFLDSVFFAKTLRKSTFMSNGVNTVKSLLDPTAFKNRGNIKQVVGSVISLALLNEVNKASTGNNMWENPDGWQYAYIKYGKDKEGNDKYIRLNTTNIEYTWLTQGLKLIGSVGNGKKFASAAKAPLQFGIGQLVDLMSNTDYKMDKIWQGSDTGDVKAKKIADYLVTEFSHPIVKNVKAFLDKPDDEQKVEKLLGGLSESPFSVKNSKTYSNAQYYKSVDDITSKLSEEDKKIYDSITKKQTEFGAKQRDKVADAQMLVNYPEVMKAQKEIAILNAKRIKTKLDPLYELSDEQLKTFYQIQGLGNNRAAQKDLKNANQWYSDLSEARSEHFKELIASGKMKEQENDYPQPSTETQKKLDYLKQLKTPEIKKKQDYYYTLPSGTGARKAYLNANPDLRKYWDTKNAFEDANPDIQEYWNEVNGYYVKVDEAFGILPTEEEPGSNGGWQNWGNYKKKSDYEKLQDSLWNLKKKDRELSNKLSKKITDLLNEKPASTKTKTIGSFFKSNKLSATRKIPLTGNLNRVKRKSYLYS